MKQPSSLRTRRSGRTPGIPLDPRAEDGVTLIEAMLAMTILTVGLLSLFSLHHAAFTATQLSFRTSEATYLAQDMMDELMAWEYTRTNPHNVGNGVFAGTTDGTDADNPFMEYEHAFNASPVGCLGTDGGGDGLPMYTRTYDVQHITGDQYGRMVLRARVSFRMQETGKRHGVTLISTRSWDRYEN